MFSGIEGLLLQGNLKYQWKIMEGIEDVISEGSFPRYPIIIITCMDSRIDVFKLFQLSPGDVFILRNAGNVYSKDMMRSLLVAVFEFNIKYIIVLGHTDCGMKKLNLPDLKVKFTNTVLEEIPDLEKFFKPIEDELKNIRHHVRHLENFPGFPHYVNFLGMLHDLGSGHVFGSKDIQDLKDMKAFKRSYKALLNKKLGQLTSFLEGDEQETEISSIPRKISSETQELTASNRRNDVLMDIDMLGLKIPKIRIPTILIPKIKINVPNMGIRFKIKEGKLD